jgi:hypothetical protein
MKIDILADLLQADLTVDRYALRGKPWGEVVNIGDPYNRMSTKLQSLSSALPLARWCKAHQISSRNLRLSRRSPFHRLN